MSDGTTRHLHARRRHHAPAIAIGLAAALLGIMPLPPSPALGGTHVRAAASADCRLAAPRRTRSPRWAYSGVRDRKIVRSMLDCPCQVIVRSFRSKRTYECPC